MPVFSSQQVNQDTPGAQGERLARSYYAARGCRIVGTNVFNSRGKRIGEIDFIAVGAEAIHFVEVKARRSSRFGPAGEAVDQAKQRKLRRLAALYLTKHPQYRHLRPQIDVCLVLWLDNGSQSVTILPNAVSDGF